MANQPEQMSKEEQLRAGQAVDARRPQKPGIKDYLKGMLGDVEAFSQYLQKKERYLADQEKDAKKVSEQLAQETVQEVKGAIQSTSKETRGLFQRIRDLAKTISKNHPEEGEINMEEIDKLEAEEQALFAHAQDDIDPIDAALEGADEEIEWQKMTQEAIAEQKAEMASVEANKKQAEVESLAQAQKTATYDAAADAALASGNMEELARIEAARQIGKSLEDDGITIDEMDIPVAKNKTTPEAVAQTSISNTEPTVAQKETSMPFKIGDKLKDVVSGEILTFNGMSNNGEINLVNSKGEEFSVPKEFLTDLEVIPTTKDAVNLDEDEDETTSGMPRVENYGGNMIGHPMTEEEAHNDIADNRDSAKPKLEVVPPMITTVDGPNSTTTRETQADYTQSDYDTNGLKKLFDQKKAEMGNPYNTPEENQNKYVWHAIYEQLPGNNDIVKQQVDDLRRQWARSEGRMDYDLGTEQYKLQTGEALRQIIANESNTEQTDRSKAA